MRSILQKYEDILILTIKEAIKPQNIQITYVRNANVKDLLTSGTIKMNKHLDPANHATEDTARHAHIWTLILL